MIDSQRESGRFAEGDAVGLPRIRFAVGRAQLIVDRLYHLGITNDRPDGNNGVPMPKPKAETQQVIDLLNEKKSHEAIVQLTGKSVANVRTIKSKYKHLLNHQPEE